MAIETDPPVLATVVTEPVAEVLEIEAQPTSDVTEPIRPLLVNGETHALLTAADPKRKRMDLFMRGLVTAALRACHAAASIPALDGDPAGH